MKQKYVNNCCSIVSVTIVICILSLSVIQRQSTLFVLPFQDNMTDSFGSEWKFLDEKQVVNETVDGSCEQLLRPSGSVKCHQEDLFVRYPGKCPITKSFYQPKGCNMHIYTISDIKECMNKVLPQSRKKEIIMLGDSRIRFIYDTLKYKLQDINFTVYPVTKLLKQQYYDHEQTGMVIKFLWTQSVDEEAYDTLKKILEFKEHPILLLIGNTLHPIKMTEGTIQGFHQYKRNFTDMVPILEKLTKITTVIWLIQPPVKHSFDGTNNLMIQLYNNVAEQLLNGTHVRLMHSAHVIGRDTVSYYPDLLHLGRSANKMIVEVILNYICNNHTTIQDENACCRN